MLSPTSEYPASWVRPNDIIRLPKRRKRKLEARLLFEDPSQKSKVCRETNTGNKDCNQRKNPFKKTNSQPSRIVNGPDLSEDSSTNLFDLLHPHAKIPSKAQSSDSLRKSADELEKVLKSGVRSQKVNRAKDPYTWSDTPPVDWSLKTNLRIYSRNPFTWNSSTLKTTEEASGTTGFVRCLHQPPPSPGIEFSRSIDTTTNAELHRRCLVWMHPTIPWLKLYPRIVTNLTKTNTGTLNGDEIAKKALYTDWCDSFRSLFQLLRSRQCAYFYMCTHSFTVLFRAVGVAGLPEVHAMITPTTRGIRQALTNEAIRFTLPFSKTNQRNSTDSGIGTDSESSISQEGGKTSNNGSVSKSQMCLNASDAAMTGLDDSFENDEDFSSWMSSVGLEPSMLAGSALQRKQMDRESRLHDKRPESTAYVEGPSVHALYNFLLNSTNIIISNSGPLAGVPPTLIAPVAFQGASLRPLRVHHGKAQCNGEILNSLELQGPILPHITHSLVQLLQQKRSGATENDQQSKDEKYWMHLTTLETTAIFSRSHSTSFVPSAFSQQGLIDCGLHPEIVDRFCSEVTCHSTKEIVCENDKFRWS